MTQMIKQRSLFTFHGSPICASAKEDLAEIVGERLSELGLTATPV